MSCNVNESAIIAAPINIVWDLVRPLNFSYNPLVKKCTIENNASPSDVGSVRVVEYKDRTVQKIKLTALSDIKHSICWDLILSEPAVKVLSACYTIRLRSITLSKDTFIEWVADFSSDATVDVTEDARYKAKEHFRALHTAVKKTMVSEAKEEAPKLIRQLSTKSSQMMALFQKFDSNKNGLLELDEFALCVNKIEGKNLSDVKIKTLLMEADLDGSGDVDYKEFCQFVEKYKAADKLSGMEEKKTSKS
eukprot:TRINITY_DN74_c0_g3_i1.p1 TRINITY_DN74_c0_g3~~TRINITY_DN74_c0_g3_i1.p1  ORF type:complete len:265 (-),score=41.67 TRINITY_DN74_c0_g3_i1:301-1047(-)